MKPTVSVIIPCFNHGHYLRFALESVLAQTFIDWEAIVVDDGSTDNSRKVAAQFTDLRIRYIYQENRGLSGARNTGIDAARGVFIGLLDADDIWESTFLERMVATLHNDPIASAAYCGFRYMDADGALQRQSVMKVVSPEEFHNELLCHGSWLNPCSVIVRVAAYREIGPFDETLRACEDYDMWLRLSGQYRLIGVPEILVRYRRTGNNMSDDVERMTRAKMQVFEKHLGGLTTRVETWSSEKRLAVSQIYLMQVQEYLAQKNVVASSKAFLWLYRYCPDVVFSLDLWYSLACVHQLKGTRGDFDTWQPMRSRTDLAVLLSELQNSTIPVAQQRRLHSLASFVLGLLHYGQRNMASARCNLLAAVHTWPGWLLKRRTWMLLIRLMPGVEVFRTR